MVRTPVVRTTVVLPKAMLVRLAEAAKADPIGLQSSHLIRKFITEGLARREKQAATAK
jgi:hypothetical protein